MVWSAKKDRKNVNHVGELTLYGVVNITMHRIHRFDNTASTSSDKIAEIVREAY